MKANEISSGEQKIEINTKGMASATGSGLKAVALITGADPKVKGFINFAQDPDGLSLFLCVCVID